MIQVIDVDAINDDTITAVLSVPVKEADFVSGRLTIGPAGGLLLRGVQVQKQ